jgi:branched-chain amino acid transport system substrate-binding protein
LTSGRAGQSGRSAAPDPSGGAARAGVASAGVGGPATDAAPGPAGAVAPGSRSPIALASVGTYTGPAGTILVGFSQGAQLWVRYINAKGGLAGHPVKLAVSDDGGDPARHDMLVRQAVERDHVVAFLDNAEPFSSTGTTEYIRQKRVPVIGISTAEPWAYSNPMYFPQSSSGDELGRTFGPPVFEQMKAGGKTKLATIYCAESPACGVAEESIAKSAAGTGIELVYRAKVSLAQPDFTAECLSASRAGAQVFFMVVDQNSTGRAATACSRQGYRPTYALTHPGVSDALKDNPLLDGAIGGSGVFPWFQSNTPASADFQHARATFGASLANGASLASGWTAGKILELAGANLPEPPTSAALLEGLWSIQDNDLGGLTYPLTFTRDRPAKAMACWYTVAIRNGAWVSPNNWTRYCLTQ